MFFGSAELRNSLPQTLRGLPTRRVPGDLNGRQTQGQLDRTMAAIPDLREHSEGSNERHHGSVDKDAVTTRATPSAPEGKIPFGREDVQRVDQGSSRTKKSAQERAAAAMLVQPASLIVTVRVHCPIPVSADNSGDVHIQNREVL